MHYLSCKKIENDVYNFPTWQYCKYKDIFDSRIIINSTAKFYISISYHKDLLSIDTRIFTPSHKNSFVKIVRHDDSKTISWHTAFPVRFARRLAALRLNSPLRGSDSGSLGRQHRKPHDGSLATVRAICFRIHHGCIILRTMFYNAVRLHITKSSWPDPCLWSVTAFQAKRQNMKKQR